MNRVTQILCTRLTLTQVFQAALISLALSGCGGDASSSTTEARISDLQVRDGIAYIPNASAPFSGVAVDPSHTSQLGNPETLRAEYSDGRLVRQTKFYPDGKTKVERWGDGLSTVGGAEFRKMYWPNGQRFCDETFTNGNWNGTAYFDKNGKKVDSFNAAGWPPPEL